MSRLKVNGGEVFHKNYMGAAAQLDADTVDGYHGAALLPSDKRLKTDIKPINDIVSAETLLNLIVTYRYITAAGHDPSADKTRFGVIAQDLQEIPNLKDNVHTSSNDPSGMLNIDPFSIMFYMIRSLATEVADLKKQLESKPNE